MSANSPAQHPQRVILEGIPEVQVKGVPHVWQMAAALIIATVTIITTLAGMGKWYLDKTVETLNRSAESRDLKLNADLNKMVNPVAQHQIQFKMILGSIVANAKELTEDQKKLYSDLLKDITYQDVKSLLDGIPQNKERRSLNALIRDQQVEQTNKLTGLVWNDGKSPVQIRFIKKKNPTLDLSKIDLYSDPPSPCSSKVIQLNNGSTAAATVQVCDAHLDQRLELIVIRDLE